MTYRGSAWSKNVLCGGWRLPGPISVLKAADLLLLGLGVRTVAENRDRMLNWIGRLLCRLGIHDYRLIEVVGSFGASGQVEKVECRRCGCTTTRSG